jgi:ribosomal-protein-alanine N-acetyltransferase
MNHKGTVRLETDRLILRKFTEKDAEAVFENWASDDEVTKFLTWPTHTSVESSKGYISFCLDSYKNDSSYQWGIELKETGELFGSISVVKVNDDLDAVELGYVIGRRFWGNGYMAEAVKAVIAFLFEEVGANRIAARHDTNNPNSGKVMKKAGMEYEGTLRQNDRNNQGIVDCSMYSILKEEWKNEGRTNKER